MRNTYMISELVTHRLAKNCIVISNGMTCKWCVVHVIEKMMESPE